MLFRPTATLLVGLVLWFGGAALAPPAWGHAVLLSTAPGDQEVVLISPDTVVLRFNEPVQPVFVRLIDASGKELEVGAARAINREVVLELAAPLAEAMYLVSYRVTSSDAHPVAGSILFAVGAEPESWTPPEIAVDAGSAWPAIAAANRGLHFVALALAAGGTIFLLLLRGKNTGVLRNRLRPVIALTAALAAGTAILAIGFQGGVLLEPGPSGIFDPGVWRAGAGTTQSWQSAAAIGALGLMWMGSWMGMSPVLGWAGAFVALASFVLTGHVVTAAARWLTIPAALAHAVPAMVWVGSFVPLMLVERLPAAEAGPTIRRFSLAAVAGLLMLAAGGVAVAVLQVRSLDGVTSTEYGRLLIFKTVLVAILLSLAAFNRFRLTPSLVAGEANAWNSFRGSVAVELAVGTAVLMITATMAQTAPPRSILDTASPDSYLVEELSGNRSISVGLTPARAGRNTLTVTLVGDAWGGVSSLSATAMLSNEAEAVEPLTRDLVPGGPLSFALSGPEFAFPGDWTVRIEVLVTDFEKAVFTTTVVVR